MTKIVIVLDTQYRFTSDHEYFANRGHFGYSPISQEEAESLPADVLESLVPLKLDTLMPISIAGNA